MVVNDCVQQKHSNTLIWGASGETGGGQSGLDKDFLGFAPFSESKSKEIMCVCVCVRGQSLFFSQRLLDKSGFVRSPKKDGFFEGCVCVCVCMFL